MLRQIDLQTWTRRTARSRSGQRKPRTSPLRKPLSAASRMMISSRPVSQAASSRPSSAWSRTRSTGGGASGSRGGVRTSIPKATLRSSAPACTPNESITRSAASAFETVLAVEFASRLDRQVLVAEAVMARYRLRDPRAARSVSREAGRFHVGGRLYVHLDRLLAWERARVETRAPIERQGKQRRAAEPLVLAPDFWREA